MLISRALLQTDKHRHFVRYQTTCRDTFFAAGSFQSTLIVECVMRHETAPRTHGLLIDWAARYDLLAWLLTHGRERQLRERFIDLAGLAPGDVVLDVGCGTGTLAIAASRHVEPSGTVCGIDASHDRQSASQGQQSGC
jgi:2-polyprenyl-3-methyl-5-hydroxy-6-metoxy-1,4-benzoquinol methylase